MDENRFQNKDHVKPGVNVLDFKKKLIFICI